MKVAPATQYQETLVSKALEATRYTPQHKALWRAVYKQAELTIKCRKLTGSAEMLVDYWIATAPEWASLSNTIDLDDLQCGFQTISQEAGTDVVPLDSLEEYGDTWQQAPEQTEQERLDAALEWRYGLHPVTEPSHLPKWCDASADPDPEAHLEPLQGFEALTSPVPRKRRTTVTIIKNESKLSNEELSHLPLEKELPTGTHKFRDFTLRVEH